MNPFVERRQDKISGVLSCFDRVVITGTLPDTGYAGAMTSYLSYHKIRLFDYPRWAEPLRNELRDHAEQLASQAGIEIEFIRCQMGPTSIKLYDKGCVKLSLYVCLKLYW